MQTYREVIYMVLDRLKLNSDDETFTPEHVAFLLNKTRAAVLKQMYLNIKKAIPESNYQKLCIDVELYNDGDSCSETYLRSTSAIPTNINIDSLKITTANRFSTDITNVSPEEFKYISYNKYTKNFIYSTIDYDNYLYLKSSNTQFKYLSNIKIMGVFDDPIEASKYLCNSDSCESYLDYEFPLEASLVEIVINTVVQELSPSVTVFSDEANNAHDDKNVGSNNTTKDEK